LPVRSEWQFPQACSICSPTSNSFARPGVGGGHGGHPRLCSLGALMNARSLLIRTSISAGSSPRLGCRTSCGCATCRPGIINRLAVDIPTVSWRTISHSSWLGLIVPFSVWTVHAFHTRSADGSTIDCIRSLIVAAGLTERPTPGRCRLTLLHAAVMHSAASAGTRRPRHEKVRMATSMAWNESRGK
jgi:hypothetical protein